MGWIRKAEDTWSKLKKTNSYKKIIEIINSNFVAKTIALTIIWLVALIPVWIYFILRALLDPIGFWQELALFFVCAVCMGWMQAITAYIGFVLSGTILFDDF